jgi:serine/threonine protein kinase
MFGKSKKDRWIGVTVGNRYRIEEAIRSDALGVVYRAHESSEGRDVQVRMLQRRSNRDTTWTERFMTEAKTCSRLAHPNTICTYDCSQTRLGQAYVVTELPIGRALREIILSEPPMSPSRVLRILMQCCASLDEAHTNGIIHGNVNPGNITVQKKKGATELARLFGTIISIGY